MALTRTRQPADLATTLAEFEFFKGLRTSDLEALARMALCHEVPKNNILSYRGDPSGAVYLVVSGRVKTILTNDEGREVIVRIVGPGGLFGLSTVLDGGEQLSNAVTVSRSTVAKFKGEAFLRWANDSPAGRPAVQRELAQQVRDLYRKIGEHALMSARDRLLYTLLEIAEAEGEEDAAGERVSFTRPTHKELANRIGSSREVVTRLLAELRDSELFESDEGRVIIVPMSALVLRND